MQGQIQHIHRHLAAKLLEAADELFPSFEAEPVHRFRVAYKKMRAFLRIVQQVAQNRDARMNADKKTFYRAMGSLRDTQLQQVLVIHSFISTIYQAEGYLQCLNQTAMELVMPLKKKEVMAVFEPADRKLTEIIDENIDRDGFFRYLRDNWHISGTLVAKTNITDEELHQVRKILKDSCYNLSIFTAWLQEGNEAFADTDELDKMATRLGKYQDITVSLNMLRKFLAGEVADRERNALAHLEEELTRRRVNERQQLLQMLTGYFSVSPE